MNTYIFDFDGTLADSKQCSILATQEAFRKMQLEVPTRDQIEYYMGIPIEQSFIEMTNRTLNDNEYEQLLVTFREMYKEFEQDTLTVFEHMDFVLESLVKKGVQLFVVSSKKTDVLYRNLVSIKIEKYFTDWIGSDQVEHYKPHPDGIYKLKNRYSLLLEDCLVIGDAIFDIQMGKTAGCKTCAVTWGSHNKSQLMQEQPTFMVEHVLELLEVEK